MRRTNLWLAVAACFVLGGLAASALAADTPTGTWKWTIEFGGQTREQAMKLKLDGDKLTGTVTGRDGQEAKIENAKFKDGEISFDVTRERDGQKFTIKYKGKQTGDAIKGKITVNFGGEEREFDWEPKRAKE
jgi:hypothetical protein